MVDLLLEQKSIVKEQVIVIFSILKAIHKGMVDLLLKHKSSVKEQPPVFTFSHNI